MIIRRTEHGKSDAIVNAPLQPCLTISLNPDMENGIEFSFFARENEDDPTYAVVLSLREAEFIARQLADKLQRCKTFVN